MRLNPQKYSHYIHIDDYTNDNYMGKTVEVTMDLRKFGYESTKKGCANYHILEGKVIGFWPPNRGLAQGAVGMQVREEVRGCKD